MCVSVQLTMNFYSIRVLMKISNKALREYRASSVDRALCEEALTLLTLVLQYLRNTYLYSRAFSV